MYEGASVGEDDSAANLPILSNPEIAASLFHTRIPLDICSRQDGHLYPTRHSPPIFAFQKIDSQRVISLR